MNDTMNSVIKDLKGKQIDEENIDEHASRASSPRMFRRTRADDKIMNAKGNAAERWEATRPAPKAGKVSPLRVPDL